MALNIIPGERFGLLVATGQWDRRKNYCLHLEVQCDCGSPKFWASRAHMRSGHTLSCGCLKYTKNRTHGQSYSRLYGIWTDIKQRCLNPNNPHFEYYGGRGIGICPEWEAFEPFMAWAEASGYDKSLEIDREKNDLGYSPGNCRWTTRKIQQRNRRCNVMVSAFGETKCISEWTEDPRCAVTPFTLRHRVVVRNMNHEKAITTPARQMRRK